MGSWQHSPKLSRRTNAKMKSLVHVHTTHFSLPIQPVMFPESLTMEMLIKLLSKNTILEVMDKTAC